jgi:Predicted transcriptional regulators
MEILKDRYSITELSQRLEVTDHALRFYEKEFGLNIPKDSRGRRYYTPETANIMFKIKTMRDDGLEIKAIKKILSEEDYIKEPPPVVSNAVEVSTELISYGKLSPELLTFFDEYKNQITDSISSEVLYTREQLTAEINKTKLELGACMENGIRKIEAKMEKHFTDVDKAIGIWREKNNKKFIYKLLGK